jgi:cell division protein FtsB
MPLGTIGPELIPIFGILLAMIPVAGYTVTHVAKSLARTRRESEPSAEIEKLTAQIAVLQEEVETLSSEVKELKAAQEFDRKLLGTQKA